MAEKQFSMDRVEYVKLMARLETVERHHNDFRKAFDTIFVSIGEFKLGINKIETKIDTLPERVRNIELELSLIHI
jgi:hypothetical protein